MNTETQDLAKRAVACKGWRWMEGMLTNRGRVLIADDAGPLCIGEPGPTFGWVSIPSNPLKPTLPDLNDDAAKGCLLALVREAWESPELAAVAIDDPDCVRWYARGCSLGPFETEAAALVAALEAAP